MKTLRRHDTVVAFATGLASYGKILDDTPSYRIEVNLPMKLRAFTVYRGSKRPVFRNLYIMSILAVPLSILAYLTLAVFYIGAILGIYFIKTLKEESFITTNEERVSGLITLIIWFIGLLSIIKFLFF